MKRKIYEFLKKYYRYLSALIALPIAYYVSEIFNTDKSVNTLFRWFVIFQALMLILTDHQHSKLLKEFNKLKNKINK